MYSLTFHHYPYLPSDSKRAILIFTANSPSKKNRPKRNRSALAKSLKDVCKLKKALKRAKKEPWYRNTKAFFGCGDGIFHCPLENIVVLLHPSQYSLFSHSLTSLHPPPAALRLAPPFPPPPQAARGGHSAIQDSLSQPKRKGSTLCYLFFLCCTALIDATTGKSIKSRGWGYWM